MMNKNDVFKRTTMKFTGNIFFPVKGRTISDSIQTTEVHTSILDEYKGKIVKTYWIKTMHGFGLTDIKTSDNTSIMDELNIDELFINNLEKDYLKLFPKKIMRLSIIS